MRKLLPLTILAIITNVCVFAQAFDDLPYYNPDAIIYFQQEMKSLFQFMLENDINIPFYASVSGTGGGGGGYDPLYTFDFYDDPDRFKGTDKHGDSIRTDHYNLRLGLGDSGKGLWGYNVLAGGNIRINRMFSIPLFFNFRTAESHDLAAFELTYNGHKMTVKGSLSEFIYEFYFGTGLFINTDMIKGAVLLGLHEKEHEIISDWSESLGGVSKPLSFRAELVPLVNTSQWRTVGKVLNNILGYLGVGAVISAGDEDAGIFNAVASTLNAGLDLTFNRINFGPLDLDLQAVYNRSSYDIVSKANTYGLRMQGVFTGFPFGFGVEGGYKHFYYIFEPFVSDYHNTGYVKASLFFPLKNITFGVTYSYDSIYKSIFGIALTTNFLSGFFNISMPDSRRNLSTGNYGARFRWNGWKAGKD